MLSSTVCLNARSASSSEVSGATVDPISGPLTITKLVCSLRFDKPGRDRCTVRGTLGNVPNGFATGGQPITIDIGGARVAFTLDNRGRAVTGNGAVAVIVPGGFTGGPVKLRVRLLNGTFASALSDEGVNPNASVRNQPLSLVIAVPLAGTEVHTTRLTATYRSTAGKRGRFLFP